MNTVRYFIPILPIKRQIPFLVYLSGTKQGRLEFTFNDRTTQETIMTLDMVTKGSLQGYYIEVSEEAAQDMLDKANFIQYLEKTLIPDLQESDHNATAEDFVTCLRYMKGTQA